MSRPRIDTSAWVPPRAEDLPRGTSPYGRPPTPMLGDYMSPGEGPKGPRHHLRRMSSQSSLVPLTLEGEAAMPPPTRMGTMRRRAQSLADRVPLPQGISGTVAIASGVAFCLSITTLAIGLSNRNMLRDATEQRSDPHSNLMRMIYTVVVAAIEANRTQHLGELPPIDHMLPPP